MERQTCHNFKLTSRIEHEACIEDAARRKSEITRNCFEIFEIAGLQDPKAQLLQQYKKISCAREEIIFGANRKNI